EGTLMPRSALPRGGRAPRPLSNRITTWLWRWCPPLPFALLGGPLAPARRKARPAGRRPCPPELVALGRRFPPGDIIGALGGPALITGLGDFDPALAASRGLDDRLGELLPSPSAGPGGAPLAGSSPAGALAELSGVPWVGAAGAPAPSARASGPGSED